MIYQILIILTTLLIYTNSISCNVGNYQEFADAIQGNSCTEIILLNSINGLNNTLILGSDKIVNSSNFYIVENLTLIGSYKLIIENIDLRNSKINLSEFVMIQNRFDIYNNLFKLITVIKEAYIVFEGVGFNSWSRRINISCDQLYIRGNLTINGQGIGSTDRRFRAENTLIACNYVDIQNLTILYQNLTIYSNILNLSDIIVNAHHGGYFIIHSNFTKIKGLNSNRSNITILSDQLIMQEIGDEYESTIHISAREMIADNIKSINFGYSTIGSIIFNISKLLNITDIIIENQSYFKIILLNASSNINKFTLKGRTFAGNGRIIELQNSEVNLTDFEISANIEPPANTTLFNLTNSNLSIRNINIKNLTVPMLYSSFSTLLFFQSNNSSIDIRNMYINYSSIMGGSYNRLGMIQFNGQEGLLYVQNISINQRRFDSNFIYTEGEKLKIWLNDLNATEAGNMLIQARNFINSSIIISNTTIKNSDFGLINISRSPIDPKIEMHEIILENLYYDNEVQNILWGAYNPLIIIYNPIPSFKSKIVNITLLNLSLYNISRTLIRGGDVDVINLNISKLDIQGKLSGPLLNISYIENLELSYSNISTSSNLNFMHVGICGNLSKNTSCKVYNNSFDFSNPDFDGYFIVLDNIYNTNRNNSIIIYNNYIKARYLLRITGSNNDIGRMLFYNNIINLSSGFMSGFYNTPIIFFNTTKTYNKSIIGTDYIGGNYWAMWNGSGYSETCIDTDGDFICNPIRLPPANEWIDNYPLTLNQDLNPPSIDEYISNYEVILINYTEHYINYSINVSDDFRLKNLSITLLKNNSVIQTIYSNSSLNITSISINGTLSLLPGIYILRISAYDAVNRSTNLLIPIRIFYINTTAQIPMGNFSSNVSNNDYWIDLRLDSAISWNVTLVVDGVSVNSSVGSGSSNVSLGYTHPVSRNSTYRFKVNYSVGGSSVVAVYGPYNVWIDLIPPTLNISWPRPGESYTEGIRTFEFYVEDDFAQVLTCSYLFTGPNIYNNTVQVQNGSTYSINLEFSRGNYYINVECSDGVNSVVESYQFNIRRSGGNEQPPQDESPPQQQETPPTDQQNQSSTDQNVTTGTIETDSNTTITNIDLNTSTEITPDSNTSDQEQPTPSSIIIQDQSNRGRTTVETEQSSETNQQIVIIPDMEGSDRNINLERSDAETDSNNQQVQSNTELKEDSTDRNNLMNVNRVINSVAVILTSPQSLAGLLGVGVSIILLMLRTVKLTIVRGERNMILLKNLFNKPVKGVTVRILDKEFQSDENGMVVTDLPVDNAEIKGMWIIVRK
ncbi:MAG: hypothetical protein QXD03_00380 [Candidatus Anstonellales archaeon]